MQGLVRTRLLLTLLGVVIVITGTAAVVLFARGFRPNPAGNLQSTGILVTQSYPDGAQIHLNGELKSATNTTLNLPPGAYSVEITLDGFTPWKKDLIVRAEEVTRATAWLFPSVPSLRAVTTTGASLPAVSPDGTKVAYTLRLGNLVRLYTLDLSESPLGLLNRESKLVTTLPGLPPISNPPGLLWSPDSRSLLIPATSSAVMVNLSSAQTTDVSDHLDLIISGWSQELTDSQRARLPLLPKALRDILATSAGELTWSPRENKLLYTATASATIPANLIKPLPGSNTQPEDRHLTSGRVYVYDLEEDRNFRLGDALLPIPTPRPTRTGILPPPSWASLAVRIGYLTPGGFSWFPTSHHLIQVQGNKVIITEYDGANPTLVYAGPLEGGFAAAYPSTKQLLILTNLNPDTSPLPNLYAVSLR